MYKFTESILSSLHWNCSCSLCCVCVCVCVCVCGCAPARPRVPARVHLCRPVHMYMWNFSIWLKMLIHCIYSRIAQLLYMAMFFSGLIKHIYNCIPISGSMPCLCWCLLHPSFAVCQSYVSHDSKNVPARSCMPACTYIGHGWIITIIKRLSLFNWNPVMLNWFGPDLTY